MKRSKADELSTITNESLKQQNHEIKLLLEPSSKEGGIIKQSAINNTADKVKNFDFTFKHLNGELKSKFISITC